MLKNKILLWTALNYYYFKKLANGILWQQKKISQSFDALY